MEDPVFPRWDTRTIAHSAARRDRRYVVTAGVVERPVAERPTSESLDAVAEWLVGAAAREIPSGLHAFDEFAWLMLATGLPLLRVTLHVGALRPQFLGGTFVWWRTSGKPSKFSSPTRSPTCSLTRTIQYSGCAWVARRCDDVSMFLTRRSISRSSGS
jgi:hypothetical protein